MKPGEHVWLRIGSKLFGPLMALFAFALLTQRAPGLGVGVIAGAVFSMALALHLLVFGVAAARAAIPGWTLRACLAAGAIATFAGLFVPGAWQGLVFEAGSALISAAGLNAALLALAGRAPTLRDEQW